MNNNPITALKTLAVLAVFVAFFSFGDIARQGASSIHTLLSGQSQTASVSSIEDVGHRLGSVVHDVVRNIKAQHPGSHLTHAHVLAIMCQELPSLNTRKVNSEGRHEGYTQVITSTYNGLVSGRGAGGSCAYTARLEMGVEGGPCGNLSARTQNARCSIEVGACLFDYELTRCNGDAACAYNAYNTGSRFRRANGASDFARGYNNLIRGQACAKAAHNRAAWNGIMRTVAQLTGGTFKTDDAVHIAASALNLTNGSLQNFKGIMKNFGDNPLGRLLGMQGLTQNSGNRQLDSGYLDPARNSALRPENDPSQRRTNAPLGRSSGIPSRSGGGVSTEGGDSTDLGATDFLDDTERVPDGSSKPRSVRLESITNKSPRLLCVPNPINPGEEAIVMWACRDESHTAVGENFETNGAVFGSTRVSPSIDTTYTVVCSDDDTDDTAASCIVEVAQPAMALLATPSTAQRGEGVTLSWQTTDITACSIHSDEHPAFERSGTTGDIASPALTQDTTFTLACETVTGVLKKKTVEVEVN